MPQEVGRNSQAISFNKGCYLGQEPVARIDALGHVNWELVAFQIAVPPTEGHSAACHAEPAAAAERLAAEASTKESLAARPAVSESSSPASSSAECLPGRSEVGEPITAERPAANQAVAASGRSLAPGDVITVDGKPVLRIATMLPWIDPSGMFSQIAAALPNAVALPTWAASRWTQAGLGYVRREARRAARASADSAAEGVLATSAGVVRIEPRIFLG